MDAIICRCMGSRKCPMCNQLAPVNRGFMSKTSTNSIYVFFDMFLGTMSASRQPSKVFMSDFTRVEVSISQ